MIEKLESRIAPASLSGNGKILTYTDIDGDLVHVTFTTAMAAGNFTFSSGSVNGDIVTPQELTLVDLQGKTGAGFTLSASVQGGKGDSHANIEYVNGNNTDLGSISVDGDLHQIIAGAPGQVGLGLKNLTVVSMGRADSTVAYSSIDNLGSLTVKTDIGNVDLGVSNGAKSISVLGSLIATDQDYSARLDLSGTTGSIKIGGSMVGGTGAYCAKLVTMGDVGSITIGGSVLAGSNNAGGTSSSQIDVTGKVSSITIKGDLIGSNVIHQGSVHVTGNLTSITIGGSVRGGTANYSGSIKVGGDIGNVTIAHDLIGADNSTASSLVENGSIIAGGSLGKVNIGGLFYAGHQLSTGTFSSSGIISAHTTLGQVTVGSILGSAAHQALIEAAGSGLVGNAQAIAKVVVKGSSFGGTIVAGYELGLTSGNFNSSIGNVTVGGDFIGSRVVAGTMDAGHFVIFPVPSFVPANGIIGDTWDSAQSTIATIGSVKIGGAFAGVPGSSEVFTVEAPNIAKLQIGKSTFNQTVLHAASLVFGSSTDALAHSYN